MLLSAKAIITVAIVTIYSLFSWNGSLLIKQVDANLVVNNFNISTIPPLYAGTYSSGVSFTAHVSDSSPLDTLNYFWSFGDSSTVNGSYSPPLNHYFYNAGVYNVSLTVTDVNTGQQVTVTQEVTVLNAPPTANPNNQSSQSFWTINATETHLVNVLAIATDAIGTTLTYQWNFNDPLSPAIVQTTKYKTSHYYPHSGNYTITLTVEDNYGGIALLHPTKSFLISNNPPVIKTFSFPSSASVGLGSNFSATATDAALTFDVLTFDWNFGDSSTAVASKVTNKIYNSVGSYTVTLSVNDQDGGTTTTTGVVHVVAAIPTITLLNITAPLHSWDTLPWLYSAQASTNGNSTGMTYTWNFGDGSSSSPSLSSSTSHIYQHGNKSYTVTLQVQNADGGIATSSSSIFVAHRPPFISSFNILNPTQQTVGNPVTFSVGATDDVYDVMTYTWEFGDGNFAVTTGSSTTVSHAYLSKSTFIASLIVTDVDGGSAMTTKSLQISNAIPIIITNPLTQWVVTNHNLLTVTAIATEPAPTIFTYSWNFGDPHSTGGSDVETGTFTQYNYSYLSAGNYTVSLTVTDGNGGVATTSAVVSIAPVNPTIISLNTPSSGTDNGAALSFSVTATDFFGTYDTLTYQWNFGDGSNGYSTNQISSTTHVFQDYGNLIVSVIVTNEDGGSSSSATVFDVIHIGPKITSGPTPINPSQFIETSPVTFSALASEATTDALPFTYTWNFGDLTSPQITTSTTISHTYATGGVYTVTVSALDSANTNSINSPTYVATISYLTPTIVGDSISISGSLIQGGEVDFSAIATDAGAGHVLTYSWNFGDGNNFVSSATNAANHSYAKVQKYTVTLTVTTENDPSTLFAEVMTSIDISLAPPVITLQNWTKIGPNTVSFISAATDANITELLTFSWNFGDKTPVVTGVQNTSVIHSYGHSGTYTASLIVTDPNNEMAVKSAVFSLPDVAPTFINWTIPPLSSPQGAVTNFNFVATATNPFSNDVLTFLWSFGGNSYSTQSTYTFLQVGAYNVTLTVTDEHQLNVTVGPQPFSITDTPPTIVHDKIYVIPAPSLTTIQEGQSNAFIVYASDVAGTFDILTYSWDFGDGHGLITSGTSNNQDHTYYVVPTGSGGIYQLTVIVDDQYGGSTQLIQPVKVNPVSPTIVEIISPINSTEGYLVTLTVIATDPGLTFDSLTYIWNFDDNSNITSTGSTVSHDFYQIGNYTITVNVTDSYGLSQIETANISIYSAPPIITLINISETDPPKTISIEAIAEEPMGVTDEVLSYSWNFGDNSPTTNTGIFPFTNHTFPHAGNFTINVTVTNGNGLSTTDSVVYYSQAENLTITFVNVSDGGVASVAVPLTFTVTATDMDMTWDILTYQWLFQIESFPPSSLGSAVVIGSNVQHSFPYPGNWSVTVTVDDQFGGSDSESFYTTINEVDPVITSMIGSYSQEGLVATFNATATDASLTFDNLEYLWFFGDGNSLIGSSVSHIYTQNNLYTVTLLVTDSFGGSASELMVVNITTQNPKIVYFNATDTTVGKSMSMEGQTYSFNATVTNYNTNDILSYTWNFGDNTTAQVTSSSSTSHIYANRGVGAPIAYNVTLIVTDSEGGYAIAYSLTSVIANAPPKIISAIANAGFDGSPAILTASATDANGINDPLTFTWLFNHTVVANGSSTNVTFPIPGNYLLTLIVTDGNHLSSNTTTSLLINTQPPVITNFTATPNISKEGQTVTFAATATDASGSYSTLSWTWNFGDGSPLYTVAGIAAESVQHQYNMFKNSYTVTYTVSDAFNGSQTSTWNQVVLSVPPTITSFNAPSGFTEYTSETFNVTATIAGGSLDPLTYTWSFSDGHIYSGTTKTSVTRTFTQSGNVTVTITVTNSGGSSISESENITILPTLPVITTASIGNSSFHVGENYTFYAASTDLSGTIDVLSYIWTFEEVNVIPTPTPTVLIGTQVTNYFTHQQDINITLTVFSSSGGSTSEVFSGIHVSNVPPKIENITRLNPPLIGVDRVGDVLSWDIYATDAATTFDTLTYFWQFGDSLTSTGVTTVSHAYASAGVYILTATVTEESGYSSQYNLLVPIAAANPVIVDFYYVPTTTITEGVPMTFYVLATDAAKTFDTLVYSWSFENLNYTTNETSFGSTNSNSAGLTVFTPGEYEISLTVSAEDGGNTTSVLQINVQHSPPVILSASAIGGNQNQGVYLSVVATDAAMSFDTLTYVWTFDSLPSGTTVFTEIINETTTTVHCLLAGSYSVNVDVQDQFGGSTKKIVNNSLTIIASLPRITSSSGFNDTWEGETVDFIVFVTDGGCSNDVLTYSWLFDGNIVLPDSSSSSESFTFGYPGVYSIEVIVNDQYGGTTSLGKTITVSNCAPVIVPTAEAIAANESSFYYTNNINETTPVTFIVSATDCGMTFDNLTYTWDFGFTYGSGVGNVVEGYGDDASEVVYTYQHSGSFNITFTVTDSDGANETVHSTITVSNLDPIIQNTYAIAPLDEGVAGPVMLQAFDGYYDILTYIWIVNGSAFTTTSSVAVDPTTDIHTGMSSITVANQGVYTVTLIVEDEGGGESETTTTVTVSNTPPYFTSPMILTANGQPPIEGQNSTWIMPAKDNGIYDVITWTWDFLPSGPILHGSEVTVMYPDVQTVSVQITVNDADGGTTSSLFTMKIEDSPPAITNIFVTPGSNTTVFVDQNLTFTGFATDAGRTFETLTFSWTFGDGSPSVTGPELTQVSHAYTNFGEYNVTLQVTEEYGGIATSVLTNQLTIFDLPPVITSFNSCNCVIYEGNTTFFEQSSYSFLTSDILTYIWDWGDNSANFTTTVSSAATFVQHKYTYVGNFLVSLTVMNENGQKTIATLTQTVNDVPPVITSLSSSSSSSKFQYGNTFVEGHEYLFTSTATDAGMSHDILTYTWTMLFNDNSEIVNNTLIFGANAVSSTVISNINVTIPYEGDYNLSLTVEDQYGEFDTRLYSMIVNNSLPAITNLSITGPFVEVAFNANTSISSLLVFQVTATDYLRPYETQSPLSYFWDFGDSTSVSMVTKTLKAYDLAGIYNVTVTVVDEDGGSVSSTKTIQISDSIPVITSFITPTAPVYDGVSLTFTTHATDAAQSYEILTYSWNFGDSGSNANISTGNSSSTTHVYSSPGNYTVTAIVTDQFLGSIVATSKLSVLNKPPVLNVICQSTPPYFENQSVTFIATVTDNSADVLSNFTWDFSNGEIISVRSASNNNSSVVIDSFDKQGNYNVSVTISDNYGASTTVVYDFYINPLPPVIVSWNIPANVIEYVSTSFFINATSLDVATDTMSYTWNFGDGTPSVTVSSNINHVNHTYNNTYGEMNITVTAFLGGYELYPSSTSKNFTINVINTAPIINATASSPLNVYGNETIAMTLFVSAKVNRPYGTPPLYYSWNFGDGTAPISSSKTASSVSHVFEYVGTYLVTASVTDNNVGVSNYIITAHISDIPPVITSFNFPSTVIQGDYYPLVATATDANIHQTLTFTWSLDGDVLPPPPPPYQVFFPHIDGGVTHNVTLSVSDGVGGVTEVTNDFTIVVSNPVVFPPTILAIGGAEGSPISFVAIATDSGMTFETLTYQWNFGDGSNATVASSTARNVTHVYDLFGTYSVTIFVTNEDGGSGDYIGAITIVPVPPQIESMIVTSPVNEGSSLQFSVIATDAGKKDTLNYTWNFNNMSYYGSTVTITAPDEGIYNATVIVSDLKGIIATANTTVVVLPVPPVITSLTVPPTSIQGSLVTMTVIASSALPTIDILTYQWSFGDSTPLTPPSTTATSISHRYFTRGDYLVTVSVHDDSGLISTASSAINISEAIPVITNMTFAAPLTLSNNTFEGQTITVGPVSVTDAGLTFDTLTYIWSFVQSTIPSAPVVTEITSKPSANMEFYVHGFYTITLVVEDQNGAMSQPGYGFVTIKDVPPVISTSSPPTVTPIFEGSFATFDVVASDVAMTFDVLTYVWSFGDGSNSTTTTTLSSQTTHFYSNFGNYTSTVTVIDDVGGFAEYTFKQFTVSNLPPIITSVTYNSSLLYESRLITFTATATDASQLFNNPKGDVLSFTWNFGDGTTPITTFGASGEVVTHTYYHAANYLVTIFVDDGHGSANNGTSTYYLSPPNGIAIEYLPPVVYNDITVKGLLQIGQPLSISVTATDAVGSFDVLSYQWSFGDEYTPVIDWQQISYSPPSASINHTYFIPGNHTISVRVGNGEFNISTASVTSLNISISNLPPVLRELWVTNNGFVDRTETATFIAFATDAGMTFETLSYSWDFGDGSNTVNFNISNEITHQFPITGIYTVTSTITDEYGFSTSSTTVVNSLEVCPEAEIVIGNQSISLYGSGGKTNVISVIPSQSFTLQAFGNFSNPVCATFSSNVNNLNNLNNALVLTPMYFWNSSNLNIPLTENLESPLLYIPPYSFISTSIPAIVTVTICVTANECSYVSVELQPITSAIVALTNGNSFTIQKPSILILNASSSFDPNEPNAILSYSWTCVFKGSGSNNNCPSVFPNSYNATSSSYIIAPMTTTAIGPYVFTVVVRNHLHPNRLAGTAQVFVTIGGTILTSLAPSATIDVSPLSQFYSVSTPIVLQLSALTSDPVTALSSIQWSISSVTPFSSSYSIPQGTITNSANLILNTGSFPSGTSITFIVVIVRSSDGGHASASYTIHTASPITSLSTGESLTVTPVNGGSALSEEFVAVANGFASSQTIATFGCCGSSSLMYSFGVVLPPISAGILYTLTIPSSASSNGLWLPPNIYFGQPAVEVFVSVTDGFGSVVELTTFVYVNSDYPTSSVTLMVNQAQTLMSDIGMMIGGGTTVDVSRVAQLLLQTEAVLNVMMEEFDNIDNYTISEIFQIETIRSEMITVAMEVNYLLFNDYNIYNGEQMAAYLKVASSSYNPNYFPLSTTDVNNIIVEVNNIIYRVTSQSLVMSSHSIEALLDSFSVVFDVMQNSNSGGGSKRRQSSSSSSSVASASSTTSATLLTLSNEIISALFTNVTNSLAPTRSCVNGFSAIQSSSTSTSSFEVMIYEVVLPAPSLITDISVSIGTNENVIISNQSLIGNVVNGECLIVKQYLSTNNLYGWAPILSVLQASSAASLTTVIGVSVSVPAASKNILVKLPFLSATTSSMANSPKSATSVISCLSWDSVGNEWSDSNCVISSITASAMTCECATMSNAVFGVESVKIVETPSLQPNHQHHPKNHSSTSSNNDNAYSIRLAEILVPIAVFFFALLALLICICLIRRRRRRNNKQSSNNRNREYYNSNYNTPRRWADETEMGPLGHYPQDDFSNATDNNNRNNSYAPTVYSPKNNNYIMTNNINNIDSPRSAVGGANNSTPLVSTRRDYLGTPISGRSQSTLPQTTQRSLPPAINNYNNYNNNNNNIDNDDDLNFRINNLPQPSGSMSVDFFRQPPPMSVRSSSTAAANLTGRSAILPPSYYPSNNNNNNNNHYNNSNNSNNYI